jgi:hypothetical protein
MMMLSSATVAQALDVVLGNIGSAFSCLQTLFRVVMEIPGLQTTRRPRARPPVGLLLRCTGKEKSNHELVF